MKMQKSIVLHYLLWISLGAVCFFVSQPLIRIPILSAIQKTVGFNLFSQLHPIAAIVCIGFSAGIFEETFRFAFKIFLMKPAKCMIIQPVLFGLGHGMMEASLMIIPLLLNGYPIGQLWLAFVERALAVILHVTLTIVVWNGFQTNKRILYLISAVMVHGLVDSIFPSLQMFKLPAVQIEFLFGIVVLCMAAYAICSKKLYLQGGEQNGNTENHV